MMIVKLYIFLSTLTLCSGFPPSPVHSVTTTTTTTTARTPRCISPTALRAGDDDGEKPFAVVVQATIEPNRMAEFLELIKTNAEETRKEPGCLRFDVLRNQESPNEFFFYELYTGPSAIDYHKVSIKRSTMIVRFCFYFR